VRRAAKRDANEAELVRALEAVGAMVVRLSGTGVPDLLVCRQGVLTLIEVKNRQGRNRATAAQDRRSAQGWPVVVVRDVATALGAVGVFYSSNEAATGATEVKPGLFVSTRSSSVFQVPR